MDKIRGKKLAYFCGFTVYKKSLFLIYLNILLFIYLVFFGNSFF